MISTDEQSGFPAISVGRRVTSEQVAVALDDECGSTRRATFDRSREVRDEALDHARRARQLARERRDLIRGLIDEGVSQAEIGRELGVTRQAIQKMLAC